MSKTKGYKCFNIKCGSCIGKTLCGEPEDTALGCVGRVIGKHMTNADRIRAMSDEELVVFLDGFSGRCLDCAENAKNKSCPIYKEGRYCRPRDIMEWLQQPMKGE